MTPACRLAGWLCLTLLLFICKPAFAQVPDTTQHKPALPTGPPAPVEQNSPRPQQRVQDKPSVQQPIPVAKQEEADEEAVAFMDRLYWGGSFGLQFGSYTNISLLPILGYKVTDKFSVGTGAVYHFIRTNNTTFQNFGGRAFLQQEVLSNLIGDGSLVLHGEYEVLGVEKYWPTNTNGYELERRIVSMPMAGLGYRQSAGRASFDFLVLYNFNDIDSPYSNPVIRAGFNIPFRR
ncbi:hypothetical protein ACSX1A_04140 [Pontibacter sp. MBLB2868]|uniref:hypothetical protein n=1 Tax=Pontibacter sp. MBLB2868 TaxID=3451555 RepID=UPI003F751608